jgi:membrane peptidoglycan carboxypeptidase
MRKRDRSLIANAASLLICGVLAGVVVAAAAFPAIAMAGLAAKAGADGFGELPTELNVPTPPQITYVYANDDKTLMGTFYDENRHQVPLTQIPKVMRDAIIGAEDERFYDHNGVDLQGIVRAFVANQQTNSTQGASTLTMQLVRQSLTYSATSPAEVIAATEQTNSRKLREIRLAIALESVLTKDEILERYLNIAAFGHGAYGIYAASQVYFSKEPKDLTLAEAALLAGLPKAPSEFDPVPAEGRRKALERRTYVLSQMVRMGSITQAEADAAQKVELKVVGKRTPNGCVATTVADWGFFCDYLYRWWLNQKAFGRDAAERESKLKSGGYRIVTTLDPRIQKSAKSNVEKELKTGSRDGMMVAAIEPGTGRVKAMAANRNYGLNDSKNQRSSDPRKRSRGIRGTFPTTTNPIISGGGDISGYKAGSTFKIFTMLAALENGFPLDFNIVARSPYRSPVYIVGTNDISVCPDRIHWCPRNASASMNGPRNMWSGFGLSVNTYFVPLQEKVGADKVIEMSRRLGIQYRNKEDLSVTGPARAKGFGPFTIGVTDTVPLELANAYATVAADGKYCEPMPALTIYSNKGEKLSDVTAPRCKQAVRPEVARAAADAARCPIRDNGGLGRCSGGTTGYYTAPGASGTVAQLVGHPVIGKTGTSDFNWTANLVLSTKQLAVAGTLADPDLAQKPHTAEDVRKVNSAVIRIMRDGMKGKPKIQFLKPPNNMVFGKRVGIPNVRCRTVNQARAALTAVGFDVVVETDDRNKIPSTCPEDTVAKTDPEGSTSKGSTVALILSNGERPSGDDDGGPGGGGGGGGGGPGGGGGGGGGGGIGPPNIGRPPSGLLI